MIIVKYNNACDVTVEFENGCKVHAQYNNFLKGNIKSPYDISVLNVGYVGEGKYKSKDENNYIQYVFLL